MDNVYILDTKDRKILAELDSDARQSNSEIGKKVGLSKEVVKYRIDKLMERGVILRFHTIVNYFRIGIMKYKLYLKLKNVNRKKREEIGRHFSSHPRSEWVVLTSGKWDMIVGFYARNVNEFDDDVLAAMNRFTDCIQDKAVTTTLYLAHQMRGFVEGREEKEPSTVVYYTTKDRLEKIDRLDEELLRTIANNARMPTTMIAKRLKTTPRVVQYRIRELERKKVILGYRSHLEPKAMGNLFCKAIIYLTNANEERINSFIGFVSSMKGVVWPQRVLGSWDFEIDFELPSYDEFQESIMRLKERFPDIMKDQDFTITYKEFKLDLFPGAIPSVKEDAKA